MAQSIQDLLQGEALIPVVTFNQGDHVERFAEYLQSVDVNCIEITLRTDYGFTAIERLKKAFPQLKVGAGTVVNSEQVNRLADIGSDFMVSPGITKLLIDTLQSSNIPFLMGVNAPSQMMLAMENGITELKFFPAHLSGGMDALKMYSQLFPALKFCPTGGINANTSHDYLNLPNVFAVGGSWFQKDFKEKNNK